MRRRDPICTRCSLGDVGIPGGILNYGTTTAAPCLVLPFSFVISLFFPFLLKRQDESKKRDCSFGSREDLGN